MNTPAVMALRSLLPPGVRSVARRVRRRVFSSSDLVVIAMDLGEATETPAPVSFSVREIGEADFTALEELCRIHRAVDREADARLQDCRSRGYHGLLATIDGVLLGHIWWVDARGHRAMPHPRIRALGLELDDRSAYLFDFYIAPAHRGQRLSRPFLADVQSRLRRLGYTAAVCDVNDEDRRARQTYRAAGWRDVRTIRLRCVLATLLIGPGGWSLLDRRWF
jgi:GNAT superfamily N-acetyltransferase